MRVRKVVVSLAVDKVGSVLEGGVIPVEVLDPVVQVRVAVPDS